MKWGVTAVSQIIYLNISALNKIIFELKMRHNYTDIIYSEQWFIQKFRTKSNNKNQQRERQKNNTPGYFDKKGI